MTRFFPHTCKVHHRSCGLELIYSFLLPALLMDHKVFLKDSMDLFPEDVPEFCHFTFFFC